MPDLENEKLRELLEGADPMEVSAAGVCARKALSIGSGVETPQSTFAGQHERAADIKEAAAVVDFLLDNGALDLGGYPEWSRLAIAFKNTFGEAGFAPWLEFSRAAAGFDSDEACRRTWEGITERPSRDDRLTIGTYIARAQEMGWERPAPGEQHNNIGKLGAGGPGKNEDHAAYTIGLATEAADEFWLDQESKPHVTYLAELPGGGTVPRHAPVESSAYKNVLADRFHRATGTKVLKREQADAAAAMLAYRAQQTGVRRNAALRVGAQNGCIYVDLGTADGRAVEIDAEGWRVVAEPPVRFVRGTRGELPIPEPGGVLADFERHFNLSLDDLRRVVGFMIGTFNVSGSYPILMTDGEQGSGKSTLNDKVVALVDPPHHMKGARTSFNTKEQDLHIGALGVHVLYFDNVSSFTADSADALCRMATGGGSGSRKLYTDDQYSRIVIIRPVILTCIGPPSSRPDLLDRAVGITAQPFARRRMERSVVAAFDSDRPKLLGFLFSCVSASLRNQDMIEDAVEQDKLELPRMADFAAFVEGAGELLGLPLGGFSALLRQGQSVMQVEAVTGHPVGAGLIRYFSGHDPKPLKASASEILRTLKDLAPEEHRWPAAHVFGKALTRLSVGLRRLGIEMRTTAAQGHANVITYEIRATSEFQP